MDFASITRAAETGQDGKGLLRIHLWCPDDLPKLWDRIEYNRVKVTCLYRFVLEEVCRYLSLFLIYIYKYKIGKNRC